MASLPRQLWQLIEPYHAVTYFAPECHQAYEHAGLRGFWRGYFAGRAAPLGEAGPGVVTATFFGFASEFVARALPSIWSIASPPVALEARLAGVDAALRSIYGDALDFGEVADLARRAVDGCDPAGRPLYAANAQLDWPAEPHLAMWHAATLLREHRGDGHIAALVVGGLDPCEAHVTQILASGAGRDTIQPYRGWTDEDFDAATARLRERGWVDADGALTKAGRGLRKAIEDDTDRLAAEPLRKLGDESIVRLLQLLEPIAAALRDTTIPYPNPIGVPAPI